MHGCINLYLNSFIGIRQVKGLRNFLVGEAAFLLVVAVLLCLNRQAQQRPHQKTIHFSSIN